MQFRAYSVSLGVLAALFLNSASPLAQSPRVVSDDDWCRDAGDNGRRERACEVREFTFAKPARLTMTDSPNGSIRVTGGNRSDVVLRARVVAWADSAADARRLLGEVKVGVSNGTVQTSGPDRRNDDDGRWSVSIRAEVPRALDLELDTSNGSIAVSDVSGDLDLSTSNGSLTLTNIGGRVEARTSNGSVQVRLAGRTWTGDSLDVSTSNGSVRLEVPENYNAHLVASTGNGSLRTDIPLTVTGRIRRELDTTLGSGGPMVRVRSGNGSVRISRPGSN